MALRAEAKALQGRATLDLIKAQNKAGFALKELGEKLRNTKFEAESLDGLVRAVVDGTQRLEALELKDGALAAADSDAEKLGKALLTAMQEAHDKSKKGTSKDVWQLYRENSVLMQAPLAQIGVGNTAEDLWVNVTRTEETVKMATELFDKFDEDNNGYWTMAETAKVQMATEGSEMTEDAFISLVIAAAPDGGRNLSQDDLERGLSKEQVIELYTDKEHQKKLGFLLDVRKDHGIIFAAKEADAGAESPSEAPKVNVKVLD